MTKGSMNSTYTYIQTFLKFKQKLFEFFLLSRPAFVNTHILFHRRSPSFLAVGYQISKVRWVTIGDTSPRRGISLLFQRIGGRTKACDEDFVIICSQMFKIIINLPICPFYLETTSKKTYYFWMSVPKTTLMLASLISCLRSTASTSLAIPSS